MLKVCRNCEKPFTCNGHKSAMDFDTCKNSGTKSCICPMCSSTYGDWKKECQVSECWKGIEDPFVTEDENDKWVQRYEV